MKYLACSSPSRFCRPQKAQPDPDRGIRRQGTNACGNHVKSCKSSYAYVRADFVRRLYGARSIAMAYGSKVQSVLRIRPLQVGIGEHIYNATLARSPSSIWPQTRLGRQKTGGASRAAISRKITRRRAPGQSSQHPHLREMAARCRISKQSGFNAWSDS
jgi:hypothetical protein